MTTKRTPTPKPAPPKPDAPTEPALAEGGPVTAGTPVVLGDAEPEEVTPDGVPLDATEHLLASPANAERLQESLAQAIGEPPMQYDTFVVLNDSGQNFLDGPVPVRPVLFTGPLVQWLSTGACPWADLDGEHVVLTLANITLEFTVGETLKDGSVVLMPGAHLWAEAAAWTLSSDGTETAVPRG